MNIAHIVYAKYWGGGEQDVYNFCKEENRLGFKNIVILDCKQTAMIEKFKNVAAVVPVPMAGLKRFTALRKYLNIIDKYNIEILNCHSGTIAYICAVLKMLRPNIKLIMYRHNLKPGKRDIYHHWLNNKTDAFICVSKLVYNAQLKSAYPEHISKYHLIYNGIDTSSFEKRANYYPQKPIKIGYAGRMVEDKGIMTLLQAADLLKNKYNFPCEIYLAGQGDKTFLKKCNDFIASKGLEDIFHYQKFLEDMSKFYKNIDIFVLPSIVREAFGLVLCEAMCSGVPVISTGSGAQAEIVDDNINGFIVPPKDADAIAKHIMALCSDRQKYQDFAAAGHLKVQKYFDIKLMVNKINTLFEKLLAGNVHKTHN